MLVRLNEMFLLSMADLLRLLILKEASLRRVNAYLLWNIAFILVENIGTISIRLIENKINEKCTCFLFLFVFITNTVRVRVYSSCHSCTQTQIHIVILVKYKVVLFLQSSLLWNKKICFRIDCLLNKVFCVGINE